MSHLIVHVPLSHFVVAAVCQLHQNLYTAETGVFNLSESCVTGILEWASKTTDHFCKSYFIKIGDRYICS